MQACTSKTAIATECPDGAPAPAGDGDDAAGPSLRRRRSTRGRWLLAYTLHRNPGIGQHRSFRPRAAAGLDHHGGQDEDRGDDDGAESAASSSGGGSSVGPSRLWAVSATTAAGWWSASAKWVSGRRRSPGAVADWGGDEGPEESGDVEAWEWEDSEPGPAGDDASGGATLPSSPSRGPAALGPAGVDERAAAAPDDGGGAAADGAPCEVRPAGAV